MKAKAKDLNGNWVVGDHMTGHPHHYKNGNETIIEGGCIYHEIDPSTLCQQVRGTEFFEGDILIDMTGQLYLVEYYNNQWILVEVDKEGNKSHVNAMQDSLIEQLQIITTGKNKHGEEKKS